MGADYAKLMCQINTMIKSKNNNDNIVRKKMILFGINAVKSSEMKPL